MTFTSVVANPLSLTVSPLATPLMESRDYATEVLGNHWDMSNKEDISESGLRFGNVSVSGGIWSGTTTSRDSHFWFLWGGYPGAYATSRDGATKPINASMYKRLTFRMYLGVSSTANRRGQFYWWWRKDLRGGRHYSFKLYPGWHTYQLDLPSTWRGRPISLRLDPIDKTNVRVKIDWIRLTNRPGTSVTLNWTDTASGKATVYMDNNSSGYKGWSLSTLNSNSGSNTGSLSLDGIIPGKYYFYIRRADDSLTSYASQPVTINQAPFIRVIKPNEMGGRDWARAALRNPWDMRSARDIKKTFNIVGSRFRRKIYSGVNSSRARNGNRKNDPYFLLNLGKKSIKSSRFHMLTFRYRYSGKFNLRRGTMSRIGWITSRYNSFRYWQISDDIVTYSGWNTITVNMKKIKVDSGKYGWRNWITNLRFDSHEDKLSRRFYVDYITLREYDRLSTSFDIKYRLIDNNDTSVSVSIYRDKDRIFGNGNEALITTNASVSPGNKSFRWRPSRRIRGLYWIYIRANDGINTAGYYSTGPLRVH